MAAAAAIKVENPRDLSNLDSAPTTKDASSNIPAASSESGADKSMDKFEEVAAKPSDVNDSAAATDIQKKMKRAERFGMSVKLTEEEKRNTRAERFGTGTAVNGSDSSKKSEELKRKARAERSCLFLFEKKRAPEPSRKDKGKKVARTGEEVTLSLSFEKSIGKSGESRPRRSLRATGTYGDRVGLLGQGPNNVATRFMHELPSQADQDYLASQNWGDLLMKGCNAAVESFLYMGELAYPVNQLLVKKKQEAKDLKTALQQLLQSASDGAIEAHRREVEELKARTAEALKEKDAELQALKERYEAELGQAKKHAQSLEMEVAAAHRDRETAYQKLKQGAVFFKKEFLESEEHMSSCGLKVYGYLETGFNLTAQLFRENGYPLEGASSDFLDFDTVVARLPPDEPVVASPDHTLPPS